MRVELDLVRDKVLHVLIVLKLVLCNVVHDLEDQIGLLHLRKDVVNVTQRIVKLLVILQPKQLLYLQLDALQANLQALLFGLVVHKLRYLTPLLIRFQQQPMLDLRSPLEP